MSEWISVDDRLPKAGEWALWLDGEKTMGNYDLFHHVDKIDSRKEALVNYIHNYTHWMPLPAPPKGE
jgi:hypothetical protein